jgi:hypothetical protein
MQIYSTWANVMSIAVEAALWDDFETDSNNEWC